MLGRHTRPRPKLIILQPVAEATDDERGFLPGVEGSGVGLGREVKTVAPTFALQGPFSSLDEAEVKGVSRTGEAW